MNLQPVPLARQACLRNPAISSAVACLETTSHKATLQTSLKSPQH